MLKETFGAVLRTQRNAKSLTQQGLAVASDLSPTYIALLEMGRRQPTLTTLFKLADALDTTPDELVSAVRQRLTE